VNPLETGWEGNMVGIVDYVRASNERVLLQLHVPGSTTDYYIKYNRAIIFNSGTSKGQSELIVTSQGGSGADYSAALLLSKVNEGESYVISNFGGTSESVTIEFVNIDLTGPYFVARVRVSGPATIPKPTSAPPPTPAPVAPTPNPNPPQTSHMVSTSTGHVVCAFFLSSHEDSFHIRFF
jgi:hypothetical protein